MKALIFLFLMITSFAYAEDQMSVRLNEKGILKILRMAVKYNTNSKSSKTIVIPANVYKFTIPQKDLIANPVVSAVNEISDLDMTRDLDFYLQTSMIRINGKVDQKSLKATITNSRPTGFDLKISLNIPQVSVSGESMNICEDRLKKVKKCGAGLKTTVGALKIVTYSRPIILHTNLRVSVKNNSARVKVISVTSNLESKGGPSLDINFNSITIPRVAIVINDQETELDTSRLKEVIMKRKSLLAKKLLGFVGNFIASDLAEMMNVYLTNVQVPTTVEVYREEEIQPTMSEFFSELYNRPRIALEDKKTPGEVMEEQISAIIRNAAISLSLQSITTPLNKDIQLGGELSMVLNNRVLNIKNKLSNIAVEKLPKLNLTPFRNHDLNLAISEPVINGALDLVTKTGLFQELFETFGNVPGFSLGLVQVHFAKDKTLRAVVNAQIDLNKVESDSFGSYLKNQWAAFRERNNNDGKIYFPIEINIVPKVVPQPDGSVALDLFVDSPFENGNLINSFNYPSNIFKMKSEVKKGVLEKLKTSLGKHTNKSYVVDITKFMNQSGVVFKPKAISFEQGAFILVNLDIADIKFNSKNPKKK